MKKALLIASLAGLAFIAGCSNSKQGAADSSGKTLCACCSDGSPCTMKCCTDGDCAGCTCGKKS